MKPGRLGLEAALEGLGQTTHQFEEAKDDPGHRGCGNLGHVVAHMFVLAHMYLYIYIHMHTICKVMCDVMRCNVRRGNAR